MKKKKNTGIIASGAAAIIIAASLPAISSCAVKNKLEHLRSIRPSAKITLPEKISSAYSAPEDTSGCRDTLLVRTLDGKELIVMRSVMDENGEMVANQVLQAAKVTARFRNIAERRGKVMLEFQIIVPDSLRTRWWQLRYQPTLFFLGDSVKLDKVMITGEDYRKRQLHGYQQYERFLRRIINDSSLFVNKEALEVFLQRNLPELFAFKTDSAIVSDEEFHSAFGVTQKEAIEHYTDKFAVERNLRRKNSREKRFHRYVKAPISTEGVRLDTVLLDMNGDFVYNYLQSVDTRPRLKKVDVVVDGEIFDQEKRLCLIARSDPLNFYISSVSAFVDDSERYITKIIERRVEGSSSYQIAFASGKSEINPDLGDNACMIGEIKENLKSLMTNTSFALDSISVRAFASPEGSYRFNRNLSERRGHAICNYFDRYISTVRDSLRREKGFAVTVGDDMRGHIATNREKEPEGIRLKAIPSGENWERLDALVADCLFMSDEDKKEFSLLAATKDPDRREEGMRRKKWYGAMRRELYPELRQVDFGFHLHRKGMVKDTVQTTELDTLYMSGIQAIKDRDFDRAIEILRPYQDYNTAVAYCAKEFNYSALSILEKCPKTAQVCYMTALIESRLGNIKEAVQLYLQSCREDPKFVHRGNLDPEISSLIRRYDLQKQLQNEDFTF